MTTEKSCRYCGWRITTGNENLCPDKPRALAAYAEALQIDPHLTEDDFLVRWRNGLSPTPIPTSAVVVVRGVAAGLSVLVDEDDTSTTEWINALEYARAELGRVVRRLKEENVR